MDPNHRGKGICTEALKRCVEFLFGETGFDRLEAAADVRSAASKRVSEKCGFQKEGTVLHGKMVRTAITLSGA